MMMTGQPARFVGRREFASPVVEAIKQLPEREKLVLTLYYQEELNLKEIGAVLEVGNPASASYTAGQSKGCGRA